MSLLNLSEVSSSENKNDLLIDKRDLKTCFSQVKNYLSHPEVLAPIKEAVKRGKKIVEISENLFHGFYYSDGNRVPFWVPPPFQYRSYQNLEEAFNDIESVTGWKLQRILKELNENVIRPLFGEEAEIGCSKISLSPFLEIFYEKSPSPDKYFQPRRFVLKW